VSEHGVVAVLGAGVMGETLLSGLLRAGRPVGSLVVSERRPERAAELAERYGVRVVDNETAVHEASTVALVVKPQDMAAVLAEIREHVTPGTLVVSLAAGITTATLEAGLPEGTPRRWSTRGWRRSARARTATTVTWRRPRSCCGRADTSSGSPSATRTP
jgi:pyrroline-5-carboxylate reductase